MRLPLPLARISVTICFLFVLMPSVAHAATDSRLQLLEQLHQLLLQLEELLEEQQQTQGAQPEPTDYSPIISEADPSASTAEELKGESTPALAVSWTAGTSTDTIELNQVELGKFELQIYVAGEMVAEYGNRSRDEAVKLCEQTSFDVANQNKKVTCAYQGEQIFERTFVPG